jgi:hypothetical protein
LIISGKQICRFERGSDISSGLCVFVCMCPLGACFPRGTTLIFALKHYNIFLLTLKLYQFIIFNKTPKKVIRVRGQQKNPVTGFHLRWEKKITVKLTRYPQVPDE